MNNFAKYISSLLNEATQEEIDKLQDAMDKVSDRPFNELFQDKGDRFLIKVYNPTFEKSAKSLGLDINKFDWKKREYDGKNINTVLKRLNLNNDDYNYKVVKTKIFHHGTGKDKFVWQIFNRDGTLVDENYWDIDDFDMAFKYAHNYGKVQDPSNINIKQTIDQNNIYYYLLFSRHPIDVLRMSDHKGISSCHRLKGAYSKDQGMYSHCALADAKNDGGIIYLIKGGDAKRIKSSLNEKEIFEDKDRNISGIRPLGRIRLRRFIDLQTGKDFAVPTTLQDEQKYGTFTTELYEIAEGYTRKNQAISQNPPTPEYARENIVLVGGTYSDESLEDLLGNFFKKYDYTDVKHKSGHHTNWEEEINDIKNRYRDVKFHYIPQWDVKIADRRVVFSYHLVAPLCSETTITNIARTKNLDVEDVKTRIIQSYIMERLHVGTPGNDPPVPVIRNGMLYLDDVFTYYGNEPDAVHSIISTLQGIDQRILLNNTSQKREYTSIDPDPTI